MTLDMRPSDAVGSWIRPELKHVYTAIVAVAASIAKEGISKARTAQTGGQGSYRFRGVDDVYNALAPKLAEHKLCILPRVLDRIVTERTNKNGTVISYVVLTVEFDFVSAVDGSMHTVRTIGEAMDTGDKATNKAMSAAYKYACFQAFCIPTEGDNDTENAHHEVVPKAPGSQPKAVDTAHATRLVTAFTSELRKAKAATDFNRLSAQLKGYVEQGFISQEQFESLFGAVKAAAEEQGISPKKKAQEATT